MQSGFLFSIDLCKRRYLPHGFGEFAAIFITGIAPFTMGRRLFTKTSDAGKPWFNQPGIRYPLSSQVSVNAVPALVPPRSPSGRHTAGG